MTRREENDLVRTPIAVTLTPVPEKRDNGVG